MCHSVQLQNIFYFLGVIAFDFDEHSYVGYKQHLQEYVDPVRLPYEYNSLCLKQYCGIQGSHGGVAEGLSCQKCHAVSTGTLLLTFRTIVLPSDSRKINPNRQQHNRSTRR
jgi:hypothetical protein